MFSLFFIFFLNCNFFYEKKNLKYNLRGKKTQEHIFVTRKNRDSERERERDRKMQEK